MGKKNKMNKNIVPNDFTMGLCLVDFIPVLFFFLANLLLSLIVNDILILIGSIICFLSGFLKVVWKIIVVTKKKNVWPLFMQMRIAMPIGFIIMLIGAVICFATKDNTNFFVAFGQLISITCFILGTVGMCVMAYCGIALDSSKLKVNWFEQICNSIAQFFYFVCFLTAYFNFLILTM